MERCRIDVPRRMWAQHFRPSCGQHGTNNGASPKIGLFPWHEDARGLSMVRQGTSSLDQQGAERGVCRQRNNSASRYPAMASHLGLVYQQ